MKTRIITKNITHHASLAVICAAVVCAIAPQALALTRAPALPFDTESGAVSGGGGGSSSDRRTIKVQVVEPEADKTPKEVAWLGVSTEEAPDAVSSQLGLHSGDGLVVIFVQPESPAAKAGVKKNDVLVEMGDQLLVHPGQLRKLVRRQKEGDTVNLTLYRSGKKQALAAKLSKTTERADAMDGTKREYQVQLDPQTMENVNDYARTPHPLHQYVGFTRTAVNTEVERSIEEARQALHDAIMRNQCFAMALGGDAVTAEALTNNGCNTNTTFTFTRTGKSAKTMVKADTNGTYVIVANPRKRLTVHDKDGKLVYDAEIETKEEQGKVPSNLWADVEPMIKGMGQ